MPLVEGAKLLTQIEPSALFVMFWHTILLEIPRYVLSGIVVAMAAILFPARREPLPPYAVSVLLPGHNEAHNLLRAGCRSANRRSAHARS
ncbi:MAG: hypothetical protein AB7G39_03205 [Alphaproteobacteria bacterium]